MKTISIIAAVTVLVSCSTSLSKPIYDDRGGNVLKYALDVKKAEKTGTRHEFHGRCSSACTLYLSLPSDKICVSPKATFGFHKAWGADPDQNKMATAYMVKKYPGWVRKWVSDSGGLTADMKYMPASYAAKYIGWC